MRMSKVMATALAATVFFCLTGHAEGLRVAVVDMARVMNTYPETQGADETIDKLVDEFEEERRDLLERYQELKQEYAEARKDAESPMWSESERKKKEADAEAKLTAIRDHERNVRETAEFRQEQISDQRERMRKRIMGKLHGIVSDYAAENGYHLVLDASKGVSMLPPVVYSVEALDITEGILAITAPDADEDGEAGDAE